MRKILFKDPAGSITVGGQTFHQGNITPAIYDALIEMAPAHKDHFEVVEEKQAEEKPKAVKPVPTESKG